MRYSRPKHAAGFSRRVSRSHATPDDGQGTHTMKIDYTKRTKPALFLVGALMTANVGVEYDIYRITHNQCSMTKSCAWPAMPHITILEG